MSCVLRFTGDFDSELLIKKVGWEKWVDKWWQKGELGLTGKSYKCSGFSMCISHAGFDQFSEQVEDAIEALAEDIDAFQTVRRVPGVAEAVLDFGTNQQDHAAYSRRVPARLIELAAQIGLEIEVSLYADSGMGGFD